MRANTEPDTVVLEPEPVKAKVGIRDILLAIRRRWRYPAVGLLIGLLAGLTYLVLSPPLYKSTARILLDRSINRYLQTNKILDEPTFDQVELESQVHILLSESIIVPVVRSLRLADDDEFVGPPSGFGAGSLVNFIMMIRESLGWNDADSKIDPNSFLERVAVEALLKRVKVTREDVANVISVTVASEDPNKAATIANAIADAYLATGMDAKSESTKIASQWLQDRLLTLRSQAMEADRELQNYKIVNNLVNTDKSLPTAEQLSALKRQLAGAQIAMADAKARYDRIQQTISERNPNATVSDALNNTVIVKLRSQYMELAAKLAEIGSRLAPTHRAVVKLREQMGGLRDLIRTEEERIAGSYASDYQIAKTREHELAVAVNQLVGEAGAGNKAQVKMRELEGSADTLRNLYNTYLQKFKEIDTIPAGAAPVQDARIITRAAPPLHKSTLLKDIAVFAGSIMLGLGFGAAAAVAKEWAVDVFRTPKVVEQSTTANCLVLPSIERKHERGIILRRDAGSMSLDDFVLDAPYSRFTETLRNLKALINAARLVHGVKVIGIVSSVAKEGKTTIAANLAALMIAASGARTLLVDGDVHKRLLSARLAPDAREGLVEALADPSRLSELVIRRDRSRLDVLPCVLPTRVPNAAELLGSAQMERLLDEARKEYDYILIEIAPIMSVVDVKMIERFVDGFILVVKWGQTKRDLVLEALSEAHMIRERLLGIVLNNADPHELKRIESYKGMKFKDYYEDA